MMGRKERAIGPPPSTTLEALVPPDHVYCHLERPLGLSFVGELVRIEDGPSNHRRHDLIIMLFRWRRTESLALAPNCVHSGRARSSDCSG
jgi:hypothetical protein